MQKWESSDNKIKIFQNFLHHILQPGKCQHFVILLLRSLTQQYLIRWIIRSYLTSWAGVLALAEVLCRGCSSALDSIFQAIQISSIKSNPMELMQVSPRVWCMNHSCVLCRLLVLVLSYQNPRISSTTYTHLRCVFHILLILKTLNDVA